MGAYKSIPLSHRSEDHQRTWRVLDPVNMRKFTFIRSISGRTNRDYDNDCARIYAVTFKLACCKQEIVIQFAHFVTEWQAIRAVEDCITMITSCCKKRIGKDYEDVTTKYFIEKINIRGRGKMTFVVGA